MKQLCLAGGMALNCVGNGRILREGPFGAIWVKPAVGDTGGASGVAQYIWYQLLDNPRRAEGGDSQCGSFLGVQYNDRQIEQFLRSVAAIYRRVDDDEALCGQVVAALEQGLGGRLVPGADGVRPAGPGQSQHPRRRPGSGYAGDDQQEVEVP